MGNCLRHESSMVWAGDDWDSLTSKNLQQHDEADSTRNMERERLLGQSMGASSSSSSASSSSREVKIKITKKELEELVGRVDMQGLSTEQVLARLINAADHDHRFEVEHQRPWRPALQSIPEVN